MDDQKDMISPPLMPDTPQAVRARQGVVSFRVVTVLAISLALAVVALAAAYVFT